MVGTNRDSETFSINLYFTDTNTPVYRVFPNSKVSQDSYRANYSRKQKQLVELLLGQFRCHYVPSAKSITGLYEDLLQPFLTEIALSAIQPHLDAVTDSLKKVSGSLNAELDSVGLGSLVADFTFQGASPSKMLTGFDLLLSDPNQTPIWQKGQGIQSTALFASFVWIAEQEMIAGRNPIWLIEEPESYLHPELSTSCQQLLASLGEKSFVVKTTHSLAFVPTDSSRVQGVDLDQKGHTLLSAFSSHKEATARIRDSLGVQFSDYYNLGLTNILTEGKSDKELIIWCADLLDPGSIKYLHIKRSLIEEFGGVTQLEGFLRGAFHLIDRERAVVAVFDGDDAGQKTRKALQAYLSNKNVQFRPLKEFISVRNGFAIEGLFPDQWIVDLNNDHDDWFTTYSVDSSGALEPFRVKDHRKSDVIKYLRSRADSTPPDAWAERWTSFLDAIEETLARQVSEKHISAPAASSTPIATDLALAD